MPNTIETLILGAGTAGLYAGYLLKKSGINSVKLLEINNEPGRKLCVAGGGYGNLTNTQISHENYIGADNTYVKYALKKFSYKKALDLFYSLDIPLEERDFGQIFSLIPATRIRDRLAENLDIDYNCEILNIRYKDSEFIVKTSRGIYTAKKVILATGSSAYPQINASSIGLDLAYGLGLTSDNFVPALTPFTLPRNSRLQNLAGICLNVGIELAGKKMIRPLLFTHSGVSGPAILLLSCYHTKQKMKVDFMPQNNIKDLCHNPENGKLLLKNLVMRHLPDRLAYSLIPLGLEKKKVAELSKKERLELETNIHNYSLDDAELASLVKAEAAKNGIHTSQLDPQTMQALNNPNLYIVGEVMDITGQLGGYNIHWALASAYCAVNSIKSSLK